MKPEMEFLCLRCRVSLGNTGAKFKTLDYELIEKNNRSRVSTKHTCGTVCSKFVGRELANQIKQS